MEKYENLGMVGEGSYGMVMKCKHKETKQMVAIKKFIESEEDRMVSKIAKREVKMLQNLRHVNLVTLLEVFRKKKRLYLVFEYVERTVLDDLEKHPMGLSTQHVCGLTWQVLNGLQFIHDNNVIHRDIKPENVLISTGGVVKLCDFGFARFTAGPTEKYTDYVATRWYRAPELLVGDVHYDKGVDIWATGCLVSEMLTGEPLFPGDSDIDQIYHISKCLGNLITRHREIFSSNPLFQGVRLPAVRRITALEKRYSKMKSHALAIIKQCLKLDPKERPACARLLEEEFFTLDSDYIPKYKKKLSSQMHSEFKSNPLIQKLAIKPAGYPVLKQPEPSQQEQQTGDEEKDKDKDKDREREKKRERRKSKRESIALIEAKDLKPVTPPRGFPARRGSGMQARLSGRRSPKISLSELKGRSPPALSKPQRREFIDDDSLPSGRNTSYSNSNLYEHQGPSPFEPAKPYSPQKYPPSKYEAPLYLSPPLVLPQSHVRIGLEVTLNPNTKPSDTHSHISNIDPQMFSYAPSIARSDVSTIYMDKIKLDLPTEKGNLSDSAYRYTATNKAHSIRTNYGQPNLTLPSLSRGAIGKEKSSNKGPVKAVHPYETPLNLAEPAPVGRNKGYNGMRMDPFQTGEGMRLRQPSLDELSETRSTQAESSSLPNV